MYTQFFGLNEKPFAITPDPRYLFLSERHSEGLAHLVYGVKESSGFIQLTGEVGTGKTTLVRTLLTRIPEGVDIALILNPQLSAVEFLTAICDELKIDLPEDKGSSKALVDALNQYLLKKHAEGRHTIVLIDEAQNLAAEVLEQIRLLTNLETAKQKLLQIILIAQPELRDTLSQTNLRQLAQRVTGRYHLEPLSREESANYIDHRLQVAGGLGNVFDARAKKEVFRFSGGVPRLINIICDRALLGAYSQESRQVTAQTVRKAAREVSGESGASPYGRWLSAAAVVLTLAVIAGGFWGVSQREPQPPDNSLATGANMPEPVAVATPSEFRQAAPGENQHSLDNLLRGPDAVADNGAALRNLLSLWGVEYDPVRGDACAQAAAIGLDCTMQRGSWSNLEQLDRPAVLILTDSAGRSHRPLLVALRNDVAELQLGDRRVSIAVDEVTSLWFGRYQLIWQPPAGDPSVIRHGDQGPKVRWLRDSLAALQPDADSEVTDAELFDNNLERQLLEFQRRNRLETDGIAGHQTQIIINSLLQPDGAPRLAGS